LTAEQVVEVSYDSLAESGVVNWLTALFTPSLAPLLSIEVTQ
jgi:hypothetical protein